MSKPMIRHCKNCRWHKKYVIGDGECTVKYITASNPRRRALLCRFYEEKEGEENERT